MLTTFLRRELARVSETSGIQVLNIAILSVNLSPSGHTVAFPKVSVLQGSKIHSSTSVFISF